MAVVHPDEPVRERLSVVDEFLEITQRALDDQIALVDRILLMIEAQHREQLIPGSVITLEIQRRRERLASIKAASRQLADQVHTRFGYRTIDMGILDEQLAVRGMTISEFQRETGLARSTIERARRGLSLTPFTMRKIAHTLENLPIDDTLRRLRGVSMAVFTGGLAALDAPVGDWLMFAWSALSPYAS